MSAVTDAAHVLALRAGDLHLLLRPDLGACIAGFWHRDEAVLRSVSDAAALNAPGLAGSFPLAPYSNRIGEGRLHWAGHVHTLRRNRADSPHPMHGLAWQRPWQVLRSDGASAHLQLVHSADEDWPFDFTLRQRFVLAPLGLSMMLDFTNDATQAQPVGLGWHPYFPLRARSRVQIDVAQRWEMGADLLPTRPVPQTMLDHPVAALAFDHCFGGWTRTALLQDECFTLRLASSLPYVVVFTPPGLGFFCVEPVSHVNNAVQHADPMAAGLVSLAPGATHSAWMTLDVARN